MSKFSVVSWSIVEKLLLKPACSFGCWLSRIFFNLLAITLYYKKQKVHVPEMRPIYCDRYGPIEEPYVRGLSRSKRVVEMQGFKVSIFCYLVIIFSCVTFWMKNFEIHTINKCYQEIHLKFFPEFFVHILRQQEGLKWEKRDFNTFEVVQYAILRVPSNRLPGIIAQMIGFTERNNWNFYTWKNNNQIAKNGNFEPLYLGNPLWSRQSANVGFSTGPYLSQFIGRISGTWTFFFGSTALCFQIFSQTSGWGWSDHNFIFCAYHLFFMNYHYIRFFPCFQSFDCLYNCIENVYQPFNHCLSCVFYLFVCYFMGAGNLFSASITTFTSLSIISGIASSFSSLSFFYFIFFFVSTFSSISSSSYKFL